MEASRSRNLRFGVFELDLHSQELRKDGLLIKLAPQAFRVLELLASQPGELVSREQIQQKVWNDAQLSG
jgi:DNA-binding winged helix-turn-helix (wHTH) protein